MIARVLLCCAAIAAAQATLMGSGIIAPGYMNAGLIAPVTVKTSSVVAVPVAVATEKRIIGTSMVSAVPVTSAVVAPGIVGHGLIGKGLYGAAPLGIISPLGLKGAGILTAPVISKAIW